MKRMTKAISAIICAAVVLCVVFVVAGNTGGSRGTASDAAIYPDAISDAVANGFAEAPMASAAAPSGSVTDGDAQAADETRILSADDGDYIAGQVLLTFEPGMTSDQIAAAIGTCAALDPANTDTDPIYSDDSTGEVVLVAVATGYTVDEAVDQATSVPGVDEAQRNNVYYLDDDSEAAASGDTSDSTAASDGASTVLADASTASSISGMSADATSTVLSAASSGDGSLATEATANDPSTGRQWYLNMVGAYTAWDYANQSRAVTVAVIDTGCLVTHEDLKDVVRTDLAYDIVHDCSLGQHELGASGSSTYDAYGHGTHVCGIIAAETDNNVGIAGVSGNNVSLLPINVFSYDSTKNTYSASDDSVIKAYGKLLDWVDDGTLTNLHVINMSLGVYTTAPDTALENVIAKALTYGIATVCSGGNYGDNRTSNNLDHTKYHDSSTGMTEASYPSDFDECISVCWVASTGLRDDRSDYNSAKDICAPGVSIYSTYYYDNGSYSYLSGSSMAAPMVTAVVAMMYAVNPQLTVAEVKSALYSTATDVTGTANDDYNTSATCATGWDMYTGWGIVNAAAAVEAVRPAVSTLTVATSDMTRDATGSSLEPTVVLSFGTRKFTQGTDFTLSYSGTCTDGTTYGPTETAPSAAGSYDVTATACADADITGSVTVGTFTIYDATSSVTAGTSSQPGTRYRIRSSASASAVDWILDAATPSPSAGSNVSIWTNNHGTNQMFTFELGSDGYYTIRNVANTSLVLDAAGAMNLGANVSVWTGNGGMNQKWVLIPTGTAGEYWIASAYNTSLVLDAAGYTPVLGANVSVWTNNGGSNQKWMFMDVSDVSHANVQMTGTQRDMTGGALSPSVTATLDGVTLVQGTDYTLSYSGTCADGTTYGPTETAPSAAGSYTVSVRGRGTYRGQTNVGTFTIYDATSSVTAGTSSQPGTRYRIRSSASGSAVDWILDAATPSPSAGSNVSIWTNNHGTNQMFTFELGSDGYYTIRNVANTSLVLDAAGAMNLGANVSVWTGNGGMNQKWVLIPTGTAGEYWIASAYNTSFVLDAAGYTPVLGANVSVWTNNGGSNQKWMFMDVDAVAASVPVSSGSSTLSVSTSATAAPVISSSSTVAGSTTTPTSPTASSSTSISTSASTSVSATSSGSISSSASSTSSPASIPSVSGLQTDVPSTAQTLSAVTGTDSSGTAAAA